MIFVELRFFVFLALVWPVYWLLPSNRSRKWWLLVASYYFYGSWDWRFLSLLALSTVVDYVAALQMAAGRRPRAWLLVSMATNLGVLGFFKYFNFFLDSAFELAKSIGLEATSLRLEIVLPVGISFYTFQTMSYTIDVYRGRLAARRDMLDFALYVAFFPQLVAGPIVRASDFLPQLDASRVFGSVRFRAAASLFLSGFFKKACVADNVAPIVDQFFANPAIHSTADAWLATVLYSIQIYCDFSGYSDMAIAVAWLLGYELCKNFEWPYVAGDISEFWRRWHISLSSWLRDYLYIPLGGNRGTRWFTRRNLMLTMGLGGLWHGAAWNFVAWGIAHGLALSAHQEWRRFMERLGRRELPTALAIPATYVWVLLTWIPFRAQGAGPAWDATLAFLGLGAGATGLTLPAWPLVLLPALVSAHLAARNGWGRRLWLSASPVAFGLAWGTLFALCLALVPGAYRAFIYFQF
jgi:alginate O-acetyltransferase complex protein AlgI